MSHTSAPRPATPEPFTVQFSHRGRPFRIYKRHPTKDAPYQFCMIRRGKRCRHSLETNEQRSAIERARVLIDKLLGDKWQDVEALKNRRPGVTLAQVFGLYPKLVQLSAVTVRNNLGAIRWLIETATGRDLDPDHFPLTKLSGALVSDFQRQMVSRYQAKAPQLGPAQREARERALRSSRSVIKQARSLFARRTGLVERYQQAGLKLPASVQEFMTCSVEGRIAKAHYHAPDDHVIEKAFGEIEDFRATDQDVYVAFWLAVGAGLRRGEIGQMRWEFVIERQGRTWISGGIGKDGETIEVPMQDRAVLALAGLRKREGRCLGGESLEWTRRLNGWMRKCGWETQKKMHELRSYVGSLIYREDPMAAMRFLRHKTIRQTEAAYVRYGRAALPPQVL